MMKSDVELVLDAQATIGEGALWDEERGVLWWVDIPPGQLHCFDPATREDQCWELGQMVGTVVVAEKGDLVLAMSDGFARFEPATGKLTWLVDPESDKPANRFNDGKCDPAGRFWAGTMIHAERRPEGALYCLDTDLQCQRHLDGVTVSNGIVWSSDERTMYYIDSPTRRVDAFDFDLQSGAISNRRSAVEIPDGMGNPDGMAIDSEDRLWVALWGGWGVACFDPSSGDLLSKIDVPASNVTTCAFGGPELEDLYITSARERIDKSSNPHQPQAGGLFHIRPGARGQAPYRFAG